MKKIEVFYLSKMDQRQAFCFFKEMFNLLVKIDDQKLQSQLSSFENTLEEFDSALNPNSNLELKEKMLMENLSCNETWNRLLDSISDLLQDPDSDLNQIGEKINKIIISHDDPLKLEGIEKCNLLNGIVAHLKKEISSANIKKADISDAIAEIRRSIWAYQQSMDIYISATTGKRLTRESLIARKKAESAYYVIIEFLNAMLVYKGDKEYADIIEKINHIIDMEKEKPLSLDM